MVSYETSLGLALSGILMWSGTLSMVGIIYQQLDMGIWFVLAQPLGFVIYLIAGVAEVNRAPFDLPEAEQELTAGYLTEFSGLRWSLYQMAEYINMITASSISATLFFGGWSLFGLERAFPGLSLLIYMVKVAFFLFLFIWLRATLPRIRYDRLMNFGWQLLLPLSVLNVVITATVVAFEWPWWVNCAAGLVVIAILLFAVRRKSIVEGTRFVEARGNGAVALPSSVRLVKIESKQLQVATANGQQAKEKAKAVQI
jgi:NADH-quinone oxidoreductase subunit H